MDREKWEGKLITKLRQEHQPCDVYSINVKGTLYYYGLMRMELRANAVLYFHFFESPTARWIQMSHVYFLGLINSGKMKKMETHKTEVVE